MEQTIDNESETGESLIPERTHILEGALIPEKLHGV